MFLPPSLRASLTSRKYYLPRAPCSRRFPGHSQEELKDAFESGQESVAGSWFGVGRVCAEGQAGKWASHEGRRWERRAGGHGDQGQSASGKGGYSWHLESCSDARIYSSPAAERPSELRDEPRPLLSKFFNPALSYS